MKSATSTTVYLKDYRQPDFVITHSNLDLTLGFETTVVHGSHQIVRKNSANINIPQSLNLVLHCERMDVQSVAVNGKQLKLGGSMRGQFSQTKHQLIIYDVPHQFTLDIVNTIDPSQNTALSGLYKSGDMLCTQCEAEGYRRITPGLDRPDNLTIYTVKLTANKATFPVLLCNGNLIESADIASDNGMLHYTRWHDPFPKPTYLFAIVAGKLSCREDQFETMHGRIVNLKFYARDRDIAKCKHAMTSLKHAMRWDEQVYGREYDLGLFNVVAVDDFNMGAMENKSLNIFNTQYVLADAKMATDDDFHHVEGVIGHEYFHNWSGNRVTCRDWFQLSLKEGFTVFRDQEFSADMSSRGVKRIDDVNALRAHQFNEDSSPMAHAVRPDTYQEINNLYTATVYDKGAEVIRMMHTMLGAAVFRQATDFYFAQYDGQAVTTDEFVGAMETASKQDLTQFKRWYSQAGTPKLEIDTHFDKDNACYQLTMRQTCPPVAEQKINQPFVIPVKTALFSSTGEKLLLNGAADELTLVLDQPEQTYHISLAAELHSQPIPSLLRGFSAPVEMQIKLSDQHLETLLIHDDDPFNRWEAAQKLFLNQLLADVTTIQNGGHGNKNAQLCRIFRATLSQNANDRAILSKLLSLPTTAYINEHVSPIDPYAIELSRRQLKIQLAISAKEELLDCYHQCQSSNSGKPVAQEMAARSLRDTCLDYLNSLDDDDARSLCLKQLQNARCMTDSASAIHFIAKSLRDDKQQILEDFAEQWKAESLVLNKWFRAQATFAHDTTLAKVEELSHHPDFDSTNPNKVYALILGFAYGNPFCFHADDGSGYRFIAHWVKKLDPLNPQVSARLVSSLNSWNDYKPGIREKMKQTLIEISSLAHISNGVNEIVGKNLSSIKN